MSKVSKSNAYIAHLASKPLMQYTGGIQLPILLHLWIS